ncbi:hypothetical protein DF22_001544 [Xylella fastidiosa]|nr:hypothetical protein DF22_001544 [Xylella fastidiosa]
MIGGVGLFYLFIRMNVKFGVFVAARGRGVTVKGMQDRMIKAGRVNLIAHP